MYTDPSTISLFDTLHDQENVLVEQHSPLHHSESSSDGGSNQEELKEPVYQAQSQLQEFDHFYQRYQEAQESQKEAERQFEEPVPVQELDIYFPVAPAHYELVNELYPQRPSSHPTPFIDTHHLALTIRTLLSTLRIPQSRLGEVLLARTGGTFSDLLNKPSHWNDIGTVKRANYERMLHWSQLAREEQTLVMVMEHREYSEHVGLPVLKVKEKKCKEQVKRREMFNEQQKEYLMEVFEQCPEPTKEHMSRIAEALGLKMDRVKNFFFNTRSRTKVLSSHNY